MSEEREKSERATRPHQHTQFEQAKRQYCFITVSFYSISFSDIAHNNDVLFRCSKFACISETCTVFLSSAFWFLFLFYVV